MSRELIASAAYILMDSLINEEKRQRRWWRRSFFKERKNSSLISSLKFQSISGNYTNFEQLNSTDFEYLIKSVGPKIHKKDTKFREAISVQDRLALTLRYMASGDSYTSLQYQFRISKQAICTIIPEVCQAIIDTLKNHVKMPKTQEEWIRISNNFAKSWNFPHVVGALEEKRIIIQQPFNSTADNDNYKTQYSMILIAIVDADYNFLYANIDSEGSLESVSKGLKEMMREEILDLPKFEALPNRDKPIPYFFLANSTFPISKNIIKPYSSINSKISREKIFDYRHTRARRVVDNSFGILTSVFQVLRKPMLLQREKAQVVVIAAMHLHNFLRHSSSLDNYTPSGSLDSENSMTGDVSPGSWRNDQELTSFLSPSWITHNSVNNFKEHEDKLANFGENRDKMTNFRENRNGLINYEENRNDLVNLGEYRDELTDYFMNEEKLLWQDRYA